MIDDFLKHHPNTAVTRSSLGNSEYAATFQGASNVLLYQLRNNISFRNLGQLKMTRVFTDGTVITAWSFKNQATGVFQDFVKVDVRDSILAGKELCTITYIDLPETVAPMRYPGEIHEGEVEGIDYIKTYYIVDISGCSTCAKEPDVRFTFQYVDATIEHKEYPHDEKEHCIYSFDGGCFAEIIDQDSDDGGTYIRWKAYTESSDQSRTGYGFVRLTAIIPSANESIVCSFEQVIKVDCCLKLVEDRPVVIHWEKCIVSDWCAAPDSTPMSDLAYFQHWSWIEMYLKANGDGCIPYEWSLSGMGELIGSDPKKYILYKVPAGEFYARDCHATLFINGEDRCGTFDSIFFESCCNNAPAPVSIGYTSLLMGCGASQTLTAGGGCGPYSWSLAGGGSLSLTEGGQTVYTAPATNPNCTSNPTITLTDCCGSSVSVDLTVNCYTTPADALLVGRWIDTGRDAGCGAGGEAGVPRTRIKIYYDYYDCNGDFRRSDLIYWPCLCVDTGTWTNYPPWCNKSSAGPTNCDSPVAPGFCVLTTSWYGNGQLVDVRTAQMKQEGCCPINPLTGLPY